MLKNEVMDRFEEVQEGAAETAGDADSAVSVVEKTVSERLDEGVEKFQTVKETVTSVTGTVGKISRESWAITLITKVLGIFALIVGFARDNWKEILAAVVLIAVAVWLYNEAKARASARSIAGIGGEKKV